MTRSYGGSRYFEPPGEYHRYRGSPKRRRSYEKVFRNGDDSEIQDQNFSQAIGVEDAAAIPKGTIDPVYEAKARVLNHAVCANMLMRDLILKYNSPDSRDWYGMVSMAALHRRWLRLGK